MGATLSGILLGFGWWTMAAMWPSHRDREPLVETTILLILTGLPWALGVWFTLRFTTPSPRWAAFAAAVALGLRFAAWQIPPVFTDDLYRYRWEGRIQQTGENPYALRPSDPQAAKYRRPGDEPMPGATLKAVYGPVILAVERVAYWAVRERLEWWRAPAALADLLTIGALALWLRRKGRPPEQALIYAWCPLPVFEFWTNGHNDAWLLLCVSAAGWAWSAGRRPAGWFWLGLATLTKWWPALLASFWIREGWRSSWVGAATVAAGLAAYWTTATENAQVASGFVGGWRNNDLLFGGLLALTGDQYRAKYLAFGLTALLVAGLALARGWTAERRACWAVAGLLAVSANVHPWYLTWLLPFLVFEVRASLLLLIALAPLLHEGVIIWRIAEVWEGVRESRWWVYGPVLALAVYEFQTYQSRRRITGTIRAKEL